MAVSEEVIGDGGEERVADPGSGNPCGDQPAEKRFGFVLLLVVDKCRIGGEGIIDTPVGRNRVDGVGTRPERPAHLGLRDHGHSLNDGQRLQLTFEQLRQVQAVGQGGH